MTGHSGSVDHPVDNPADSLSAEAALDRALNSLPVPPVPAGLAARIIATVPQLPQVGSETAPVADNVVPLVAAPAVGWRRYAVPVGLGGVAAAAAALAAVFLASAQGWQAPAVGSPEGQGSAVAVAAAPAAAPSLAAIPASPAPTFSGEAHLSARRTPAATPVLALTEPDPAEAQRSAVSAPAQAAPDGPSLAANAPDPAASDPPIPQLSPAEAAEVERRAARRAAREEVPVPGSTPVPSLGFRPASATQR